MSGNSFGKIFKLTTFGESHGPAIGGIIDGCPPNLKIDHDFIAKFLSRRKPGKKYTSARKESDHVQWLSGVFEGKTLGTPISFTILNNDARSSDYSQLKNIFRPGHGDISYFKKYGIRDYRGGGRSSARETVARVVAGGIAKLWLLEKYNIRVQACCSQIGEIVADTIDFNRSYDNEFNFGDSTKVQLLIDMFNQLITQQDSVGAKIIVKATNVPAGIGEPVFDKLDAQLAYALMGINAVKAVSIGAGTNAAVANGSAFNDEINATGFKTNNAGGILAGISTGQDIYCDATFKPTSSINKAMQTINTKMQDTTVKVSGRHDPCVAIRACAIVEAMVALVLIDNILLQSAYKGEL